MCEKCNDNRQGESWKNFLAKHKLRNICDDGNGWRVDSASGSSYHVRSRSFVERESGGLGFRMQCDCPARGDCRHIAAVLNMRHAEELAAAVDGDADGMEMLERTQ